MYVRRCSNSCISDSDTWCVSMSTSTSMSRLTCLNHQAGDLIHDHLLEHFLFQFVVLSLLRYCSLLHACLQFSFSTYKLFPVTFPAPFCFALSRYSLTISVYICGYHWLISHTYSIFLCKLIGCYWSYI